jgi:allophanate hydrolase
VAAEPLQLNSNLGLYTSFVNLLDLAAIALPVGFGLIDPAFRDLALLDLGARFQHVAGVSRGAAHAL